MLIHVRFEGKSEDIELERLGLARYSSETEIKEALARHYDRSSKVFDDLVVEVQPNGNIVVRPKAIFG